MMKHIRKTGALAAALAATAFLALPAAGDDLRGGVKAQLIAPALKVQAGLVPQKVNQFRHGSAYRGYGQDVRPGTRPYNIAMSVCSERVAKRAWNRGAWSAWYVGQPQLTRLGDRKWTLTGKVRVRSENGIRDRNLACDIERGQVVAVHRVNYDRWSPPGRGDGSGRGHRGVGY